MASVITDEMRRDFEEHMKKYPPFTEEELEEFMTLPERERCKEPGVSRHLAYIMQKCLNGEL